MAFVDEVRIAPDGDPFYAAAQDHPHACLDGYVYLGFTYTGEDGEEYEAFEAVPCRRCAEEATEVIGPGHPSGCLGPDYEEDGWPILRRIWAVWRSASTRSIGRA